MPKPSPDSVGSSLSVKEKADVDVSTISFTLPYIQNGATFYKFVIYHRHKQFDSETNKHTIYNTSYSI